MVCLLVVPANPLPLTKSTNEQVFLDDGLDCSDDATGGYFLSIPVPSLSLLVLSSLFVVRVLRMTRFNKHLTWMGVERGHGGRHSKSHNTELRDILSRIGAVQCEAALVTIRNAPPAGNPVFHSIRLSAELWCTV